MSGSVAHDMIDTTKSGPPASPADAEAFGEAQDGYGPPETDGRRQRRVHNRDAVVDALLDIYRDGNLQPSTDEIAERAGLSPRSIFRYFDDADDLARSAVDRQLERTIPLLPIAASPGDPLVDRVRALADQRFLIFEESGQAAKVSRLRSPSQPLLAERTSRNRAFLRQQLIELFAPELHRMGGSRSAHAAAAVDVMTSFESWQLLTEDQQFGPARAKSVMVGAVTAILGVDGPPPQTGAGDPTANP
jgi:TetR/AcrR family transcriptional regulator of autoinduction and epiphytic fitness